MSEMKSPQEPDVISLLTLNLVQQMRNYDVLMHILSHFDESVAEDLKNMHEDHEIWGPLPFIEVD